MEIAILALITLSILVIIPICATIRKDKKIECPKCKGVNTRHTTKSELPSWYTMHCMTCGKFW